MNFHRLKLKAIDYVHTIGGRNLATFIVFLVIATFFWFLMALNDELQRDFTLPVKFENVPNDVTLLRSGPIEVSVSIKDKGSSLIRHSWGRPPVVKFDFSDVNNSQTGRLFVSPQKMNNALRNVFGQGTIASLKPDSLLIPYTRRPGKIVGVKITEGDIRIAPQYVRSGPLYVETDTVRIYSQSKISRGIMQISTEPVSTNYALNDTTRIKVPVVAPDGMVAIPAEVTVVVPVEPLISRDFTVGLELINVPRGKNVVTFPSKIGVNVLIPMSRYNSNDENIPLVVADYSRRNQATAKMPVTVIDKQKIFNLIELSTDSVEFLMEQN